MSIEIDTPPNTMPRIDTIWAYLSVDINGNEGVIAAPCGPHGMPMPLIAADPKRLEDIKTWAEIVAREAHIKVKLVQFSQRTELSVITAGLS